MIIKRLLWVSVIVSSWTAVASAIAQTPDASVPTAPFPALASSSWSSDLSAALKQAETEKKMIIVEVTPDWNVSGKKFDAETFPIRRSRLN